MKFYKVSGRGDLLKCSVCLNECARPLETMINDCVLKFKNPAPTEVGAGPNRTEGHTSVDIIVEVYLHSFGKIIAYRL